MGAVKESTGQKMAGFITHMAPAYPEQDREAFADPIKQHAKKKGLNMWGVSITRGF